jgi:hypothetical protein
MALHDLGLPDDLHRYRARIDAHLAREWQMWLALRSLLRDRPGWHFEPDEGEPGWCFGAGGTCHIFVSVRGDHFHVYEPASDQRHSADHTTLEVQLYRLERRYESEIIAFEVEEFLERPYD